MRPLLFLATKILSTTVAFAAFAQAPAAPPHNIVLFVADGLRFRMVDDRTAPTMAAIAREGVSLRNSHALFPTFTTANASGLATGHMLGDTGDFSNTIYTGFEVPSAGNSSTPFLENDAVLGEVDAHFSGNYLDEATILKLARDKGYSTAAIGKLGPALIFDSTERSGGQTILFDDATGTPKGIPLSAEVTQRLQAVNLPPAAPSRGANGAPGNVSTPGTITANVVQQDYFAAVATRVVLPMFKERNKPFLLVFWSRDPDGTQHNQGDSLNVLVPGINGPTSLAAIRNADDDLARIRSALSELGLLESTNIIVASDHGFSTISKESQTSSTVATRFSDTLPGHLPFGFVALDLSHALNLPLIDPDDDYKIIGAGQHTKNGNGLIGGDRNKPQIVVAANGGSDLIYIPDGDAATAKRVIDFLLTQDYVSGIFVDSKLGKLPGTLSLDDIALEGAAITPHPAIAISFRSFDTVCGEPVLCTVEVADTALQQGQGMHGSFGRADTWNFMAMQGPDFKSQFVDPAPASNADLGRTIAHLMQLDVKDKGKLTGRVLSETLPNGAVPAVTSRVLVSDPAPNGLATVVNMQMVGEIRYYDAAGFSGRTVGLSSTILPAATQ
ncbi:MAG: alkaline phosphatase family protein [Hyphomicrobiales bacterium]|nr:alkaline phosphatase family protein [Hyphomicrobiales bacterium]MBV8286912.1 alkaline phosphatase family protein [Hyphomicrobiales bacterium]